MSSLHAPNHRRFALMSGGLIGTLRQSVQTSVGCVVVRQMMARAQGPCRLSRPCRRCSPGTVAHVPMRPVTNAIRNKSDKTPRNEQSNSERLANICD